MNFLDEKFKKLVDEFEFEKVTESEESMAEWLQNFRESYLSSIKSSKFNLESKFMLRSLSLSVSREIKREFQFQLSAQL